MWIRDSINTWLSLCFARPETPLDSPEGFYRHFQALSRHLLSPGEQKMSSIETIIRYTDDHYTEDISVNGLADQFGLTPNYLSAQFKRCLLYTSNGRRSPGLPRSWKPRCRTASNRRSGSG